MADGPTRRPPALPPGLYAIADAALVDDPVAYSRALVAAGCRLVQLRAKGWPRGRVVAAVRVLLPDFEAAGALLVVNDDPVAAALGGAHGVHVGATDAAIPDARAAVGPARLVGRTVRSAEEAVAAARHGADYVGFGPVFPTRTKEVGIPPRGLDALAGAVRRSPVPVVAIGGIDARTLPAVRAAGARHWAVVSALARAPDLPAAIRLLDPVE